jgi:hypothetical protein
MKEFCSLEIISLTQGAEKLITGVQIDIDSTTTIQKESIFEENKNTFDFFKLSIICFLLITHKKIIFLLDLYFFSKGINSSPLPQIINLRLLILSFKFS